MLVKEVFPRIDEDVLFALAEGESEFEDYYKPAVEYFNTVKNKTLSELNPTEFYYLRTLEENVNCGYDAHRMVPE